MSPTGNTKSKPPRKKRETGVAASHPEFPGSTNISSPIQAASRCRAGKISEAAPTLELHKFKYSRNVDSVLSDDEDEYEGAIDEADDDSEEDFEPQRVKGKTRIVKRRPLGPPITTDEKIERLNTIHQIVVDGFLNTAKDEGRRVSPTEGLWSEVLISLRSSYRRV